LDVSVVGLLGPAVWVLIESEVPISIERLGILHRPSFHFGFIHKYGVGLFVNPCREFLEDFTVVVLTDPRVHPEIPPVKSTDEVFSIDMAVGQEGAPVEATTVENGDLIVVTDDHEIDARHQGIGWGAILQFVPHGHPDGTGGRTMAFSHDQQILFNGESPEGR
jgi:hypothetical protein